MQLTDLLNRYGGVATNLGIDLVAILLMAYVLHSAAIGERTSCCPTSR